MQRIIIIILISIVMLSCRNKSITYDKWHLESIEISKIIDLGMNQMDFDTIFVAQQSSDRFEVRLFFPDLKYHELPYERQDSIDHEIFQSINRMQYQLVDFGAEKTIEQYTLEFPAKKGSFVRVSFNINKPLSLWLDSKITFKRGDQYRLHLRFPSDKNRKIEYQKPVLVIGTGYPVYP